jgi:transmembrane sensor
MKDNTNIINDILARAIFEEVLAPEEQDILNDYLADPDNAKWFQQWKEEAYRQQRLKSLDAVDMNKWKAVLDQKIAERGQGVPVRKMVLRYAAAAAAVLFVSVAAYLWFYATPPETKPVDTTTVAQQTHDVAPGQTKAMLTLGDGTTILLDSAGVGQLATQGSTRIDRENGQLVYKDDQAATNNKIFYNTLTTSKGETFTLVLPDGTQVTLNSASSVRYPTAFTGTERRVEVTGEAYFAVAHRADLPFIVSNPANDINVKVLGTEFNVHTYADEQPAVTLIKGSVQVSANQQVITIQPREQVVMTATKGLVLAEKVDLDEVLAWKRGRFYFSHANITTVMKQLERWYNIEVVYEGVKPTEEFGGELPRSFTLAQVIKALEHTGVKFKIEGRKLIVLQ